MSNNGCCKLMMMSQFYLFVMLLYCYRLNFLSHKYWQKLIGFARNLPLSAECGDTQLLRVDILQIACVMAYCEYFVSLYAILYYRSSLKR